MMDSESCPSEDFFVVIEAWWSAGRQTQSYSREPGQCSYRQDKGGGADARFALSNRHGV